MISDYYYKQMQQQKQNTKSIKLKANQIHLQPFIIPKQHFTPNQELYEQIKDRCQQIKSQFSFIKSEILRQHKRKKQKHQRSLAHPQVLADQQIKDEVQKLMSQTCKKLIKMQQNRKLFGSQNDIINKSQTKKPVTKKKSNSKQNRLSSIMGQSVVFIKKNQSSENLSSPKNMRKPSSFLRFSLSMSRQQ